MGRGQQRKGNDIGSERGWWQVPEAHGARHKKIIKKNFI